MKMPIVALALTAITFSANARNFDIDVNISANNRLKDCRATVTSLKKETVSLKGLLSTTKSNLSQCKRDLRNQQGNGDSRRLREDLDQANRTITKLENTIDRKNDTIQDLKRDIQDLQDQLNPRPVGINLAAVIKACGNISSSSSTNKCIATAKKYQVNAKRVTACTAITSSFSAVGCVEEAGINNTNASQIKACVQITSSSSAVSCVKSAGAGNVPGNVVQACVNSSSSSYSQVRCVEQMRN